ncbi:MAG TPA: hypothetical protein VF246_02405 [Acidimicrobiia bacterium]
MKSHDFDPVSFVAGVVMTVIGLLFLLPRATRDLIHYLSATAAWIWPALLIAIGVAILASVASRQVRARPDSRERRAD